MKPTIGVVRSLFVIGMRGNSRSGERSRSVGRILERETDQAAREMPCSTTSQKRDFRFWES